MAELHHHHHAMRRKYQVTVNESSRNDPVRTRTENRTPKNARCLRFLLPIILLETPDVMESAFQNLTAAIARLPNSDKAAFVEASRRCPNLVHFEANPRWFLRLHRGKASAAALMMASYWQHRVEVFADQAFEPLEELLTEEDKELLTRNAFVRLPDNEGKPVLLLDLGQVGSIDGYDASRSRLMFYWAWKLGETKASQTDGVVMLRLMKHTQHSTSTEMKYFTMVERSLPFHLHSLTICAVMPSSGDRELFCQTAVPLSCTSMGQVLPRRRVQIHVAKAESEILLKLQEFEASNLPPGLGGTWNGCVSCIKSTLSSRKPTNGDRADEEQAKKRLKSRHGATDTKRNTDDANRPNPSSHFSVEKRLPRSLLELSPNRAPVVKSAINQVQSCQTQRIKLVTVREAFDSLRRNSKCSVRDLVRNPSVCSRVLELICKELLPPVSATTKESLSLPSFSKFDSSGLEKPPVLASVAVPSFSCDQQKLQKMKLKVIMLRSILKRLSSGLDQRPRPNGLRDALVRKIEQNIAMRKV